jgi:pilus assembly protein CpaE
MSAGLAAPSLGALTGDLLEPTASRHDRPPFIAFVTDGTTETVLREGLVDMMPGGTDIRRGGIRAAIAALQKATTPRVLVVDVSGHDEPLTALAMLSEVVEPDVCVLVVGESDDLNFYREVTRGLGAAEYLCKPLSRDVISRHFGPLALGRVPASAASLGGRMVSITGAHGGAGASTIAASLAWHLGMTKRRHTVLLDGDLHRGTAALLLNATPGPGLRLALETPERVDSLLAERAANPVGDRLHVLSSQEDLSEQPQVVPGAGPALLDALRRRYNFIVADAPYSGSSFHHELLELSHQRVIVTLPTLVGIRDSLRLLALLPGAEQIQRPVMVLNRVGMPGGLPRKQVEQALGIKADVAIPDQPRQIATAATVGEPAVNTRGPFQAAIHERARQVAATDLLDAAAGRGEAETAAPSRGRWGLGRLFR